MVKLDVRVRLTEVSAECRLNAEHFGTSACNHLIEGVRLIWGPLNTGFTVLWLTFNPGLALTGSVPN